MRKFIYILLLLILYSNLIQSINSIELKNNYMMYVYASRSCPHCLTLANYLIDNNIEFKWFWIEEEENLEKLRILVDEMDIAEGTPTTIVYIDGEPRAIVLGAITEDKFWENLINNPTDSLRIFYGDKLVKEMPIPTNFTDKYISTLTAPYDDVLRYAKGDTVESNPIEFLPTLILIALLIGAALFIYLRKV